MMKGLTIFRPLCVLDVLQAWYHLSFLICRLEQVAAPCWARELGPGRLCAPGNTQTYWINCPLPYYFFDYTMPCP